MITLITKPNEIVPNAVEDCIYYLMNAGNYRNSSGMPASIEFCNFGITQANDDTLIINGQTFTVDDSTPFTHNTWDGTEANAEQQMLNLYNMLMANYHFTDYLITHYENGGAWCVKIEANVYGVIDP